MTYVDKPHTARYTGRGLGWAKKLITQKRARHVARYQASLIIDTVLTDGWAPDDLIDKFGEDGFNEIYDGVRRIAKWLLDTTPPDGHE